MNILYITDHTKSAKISGGYINDYLNDLLFYGLYELEDIKVTDSTPIIHLYKENQSKIPIQHLWGKGFTATFLIDKNDIDIYILRTDAYLALDQQSKAVTLLEEAIQQFDGEERIDLLFELADVYDDYEAFEKIFDCLK